MCEEKREHGMLEVREACGLGEVGEGSKYLGKGKLRKEETPVQKLHHLVVRSCTKDRAPGRGKFSSQFSLPKITFESPYKI